MTDLRTSEPRLRHLIDAAATYEQLPRFSYKGDTFSPAELLEGLILTESNGNPQARRYERHQDVTSPKESDYPEVDNGVWEDDASYGLGQVMGTTFKGLLEVSEPVRMNFSLLYNALVGIALSVEVLKRELRAVYVAHPNQDESERVVRALCRYNGGPTGDVEDPATGDLRRRSYVNLVAKHAKLAQDDRREKSWFVA